VLSWGGFSAWLILLALIPVLGWIALWVLLVVAAHRINPGFGYGGGMTVVAALFFVVWTSILGFGPARWLGARATPRAGAHGEPPSRPATLGALFGEAVEPREPVVVSVLPPEPIVPEPFVGAPSDAAALAGHSADAPEAGGAGDDGDHGDADDDPLRLFAPPPVAAEPSWTPPDTTTAPPTSTSVSSAASSPVTSEREAPAPAPAHTGPPAPVAAYAVLAPADTNPAATDEDDAWPSEIDDVSAIVASPFPPSSSAGWRHAMPPVTDDAPIDAVPGRRSTAIPGPMDAPRAEPAVPAVPAVSEGSEGSVRRVSAVDAAARAATPTPEPPFEPTPAGALLGDETPESSAPPESEPPLRRARPWPAFAVASPEPDGFPELSGEVSAVIGSPAAGSPRAAAGAVAAQHRADDARDRGFGAETAGSAADDDIDQTVITRRARKPLWQLVPASAAPVPIVSDVVILGRRPARDAAFPAAQLLPVPGEALTVSKTHARLELRGEVWTITDLASTNGVLVRTLMGDEIDVEPGSVIDAGERFFLGDEEFHLQRLDR